MGGVDGDLAIHIRDMLLAAGRGEVIDGTALQRRLLLLVWLGVFSIFNGDGDVLPVSPDRLCAQRHGVKLNGSAVGEDDLQTLRIVVWVVHGVCGLLDHIGWNFDGGDRLAILLKPEKSMVTVPTSSIWSPMTVSRWDRSTSLTAALSPETDVLTRMVLFSPETGTVTL